MPPKPVNPQAPEFLLDARCEYHMGGIGHWTYDCYHHRHRIQDLLDHQLLSFYWRGRNAYYALKNPCPSLQDESESSSLCKKRKTAERISLFQGMGTVGLWVVGYRVIPIGPTRPTTSSWVKASDSASAIEDSFFPPSEEVAEPIDR